MKLVADTNILFSFFWENSLTRKLLISSNLELLSPEKAIVEINKYKREIKQKTNLTEKKFNGFFKELKSIIRIIKKEEYSYFLQEARQISPDIGDSEFLALCIKYSCALWSNDSALKNQNKIRVFNTDEIINLFI